MRGVPSTELRHAYLSAGGPRIGDKALCGHVKVTESDSVLIVGDWPHACVVCAEMARQHLTDEPCHACKGAGVIGSADHWGNWEGCDRCEGTGREFWDIADRPEDIPY